jgi:hypothetical protein
MINLSNEDFAYCELHLKKTRRDFLKTTHHPETDSSLFGQIFEYRQEIFDNRVFDNIFAPRKIPDSRIRRERKCGVGEI